MNRHWKIRHRNRKQRGRWFLLFLMLVGGWFFFARPSTSNAENGRSSAVAMQPPNVQGETYWSDDVTVSEGRTIDGDLVVYSGAVTIESGGSVSGSVIDYSGDVTVEEGGSIHGDLTIWSGNVRVDGHVGGSIAAWSGDVELGESALVDGDVSAMSGDLERSDGAQVKGSVVRGPGFKWPGVVNPFSQLNIDVPNLPNIAEAPAAPSVQVVSDTLPGPIARFFGFILRLIGAIFFSAIASLLAALVFNVRPELVGRIRANLHDQPVYAAVAGAVLNVPLLLVAGLLFVTFCLAPLALPPLLLLLVLNLVGVTGIAQIAGERLTKALNLQLEPVFVVGLGAFAVVGGLSLLWAFGGCFRGIAWLVGFVGGSMGVGALIMPWLKNFSTGYGSGATSGANTIVPVTPSSVDVTIGADGTQTAAVSASVSEADPEPSVATSPVTVSPGDISPVDVQIVEPTLTNGNDSQDSKEQSNATEILPDDFTIIKGIGSVLDRRLKEAGIMTFAQLAELTPDRLAEIFDRPLSWILEDDIIGQAGYFARTK